MRPDELLREEIDELETILLTPRYSANLMTDPRDEPLVGIGQDGDGWFVVLRLDGIPFPIPVHAGEPVGEAVEVAPQVMAWTHMEKYGLEQLGPGVWKMEPSFFIPGALHVFLVLRDVPEPAPFAKPVLFSGSGERIAL